MSTHEPNSDDQPEHGSEYKRHWVTRGGSPLQAPGRAAQALSVEFDELPPPLPARLQTPKAFVDLTDDLEVIESLTHRGFGEDKGDAGGAERTTAPSSAPPGAQVATPSGR